MPQNAEVFTWPEGSAQLITGGATSLLTYARNVTVQTTRRWNVRRAPYSTTYEYLELGRQATVSFQQAFSQSIAQAIHAGATAGGFHVRLPYLTPGTNASAGWLLYSGVLEAVEVQGGDGEQALSIQGQFQNWTAW